MASEPKTWPCCDESSCARAELAHALAPDSPIEEDIDVVASTIAQRCPMLDRAGLAFCFSRTFELPPECQLFDRFCKTYQDERSAPVVRKIGPSGS